MRKLTCIIFIIIIAAPFAFGQQIISQSLLEDGIINKTELNDEYQSNNRTIPILLDAELFEIIRLDSSVMFRFYDDSDSMSVVKYTYTYNEFDNTLLFVFTFRSLTDTVWQNYNKSLRTFNSNYQEIHSIYYQGDGQSWIKRDKYIYEYENNSVTLQLFYMWDSNVYEWKLNRKSEMDYNSAGQNTQSITSGFNELEQSWIYQAKTENDYDAYGRSVNYFHSWWNSEESLWKNNRWQYYTYDDEIKSTTYYNYDSISWIPTHKYIGERIDTNNVIFNSYNFLEDSTWFHTDILDVKYDNMDNIICQESYKFLETDSSWVGDNKIEKTYNESGQQLTRYYYNWIVSSNDWIPSTELVFRYNDLGAITFERVNVWDPTDARWYKDSSRKNYYSDLSSIENNNSTHSQLNIHPSPCDNQINISNLDISDGTYKIYSLAGILLDKGAFESKKTIGVSKLDMGYYILKIEFENKVYSGKFLKL